MSRTQSGRKPLSSKSKPSAISPPNFMANKLGVPVKVAEAIAASGKECRWINYKKFVNDGGIHENGWIPYKASPTELESTVHFGNNPDGIIRRGDCLLAVRPKDQCQEHRDWIKQKTEQLANIQEDKAKAFRARAQGAGLAVEEGYEDDASA